MTQYNFADLSFPGASQDFATGINDLGQIVGYYGGIGFLYSAGAYTAVSYPETYSQVNPDRTVTLVSDQINITQPTAINASGQIVGLIATGHAFIGPFLYSGGTYTALHEFGIDSFPVGINNAGQIVGSFFDFASSSQAGFLFSGGAYTTLQDPLAAVATTPINVGLKGTVATDINNVGQIVGYYFDSSSDAHGFVLNNGTYTTVDDPLGTDTFITGENDNGQIVGYYDNVSANVSGNEHGFIYSGGTFTTIDNPSGMQATLSGATGGTELNGINNAGDIVGTYFDSAGLPHGFIASTGTISFVPLAYSPDTASTIVYAAEYGSPPDPTETFKLIGFTNPQYAYGQQIGVIDPVIYTYESLGSALASGASHFQNTYGPTAIASDNVFVTNAYTDVFGNSGTPAQVQHFVDQLNFLEALYTASGSFGSPTNVDLIARGAVYGQMLGVEAEMTQVPIVGTSAHV
jgi:probable HAF family extracellular repeat protein